MAKLICGEEIVKEIDKLCNKKASWNTDIPVKNIVLHNFYFTILISRSHGLPYLLLRNLPM